MKMQIINFTICFLLSLTMYSQTIPETKEVPTTPPIEQPSPYEALEAPEVPEAPEAPEVPEVPKAPEVPEASEASEAPFSQEVEHIEEADKEDGKIINIVNDNSSNNTLRVGMLDLGISTYLDNKDQLDLPDELNYMDQRLSRSINIGIHLINLKMGFRKKEKPQNFGFSTGIKWNIVHYSFEKDFAVSKNADRFQDGIDYNVPALKHNRLKANHLQVPFLLEFNSKPKNPSKSLNIAVGMVFQLLLNSNYKYKTETGDKTKVKGDFNLSKFNHLLEARFGYGPLNFYIQYGAKVFQTLDGPDLRPINFGVNVIPR